MGENNRTSRYGIISDSPTKIEEQKTENRKNFNSTQGNFFTKKKEENFNFNFNPRREKEREREKSDNAVSLNSTVGLFENLNKKLEEKNYESNINKNKIKIEN